MSAVRIESNDSPLRRRVPGARFLALLGTTLTLGGCPFGSVSVPDTVPDFSAAVFTNPTEIDHEFFPLVVGTMKVYAALTPDGQETTLVEVLDETRTVAGVTCRVVRDRVYLDGRLIEDTRDYYAQDDAGNVWYLGERVDNYNYDSQSGLIDVTHEGSWEAGLDTLGLGVAARPGFILPATPTVGQAYHQEFYFSAAEDEAEIVGLAVAVTLSDGASYTCLQTRDFTRLEPAVQEYKYYAPGVGLVLEEPVGGGARLELTSGGE